MILFFEGQVGGRSAVSLVSVVDDTMTALACPLFDDAKSAAAFLLHVDGLGLDPASLGPRQLQDRYSEWVRASERDSGAVLRGAL